MAAATRADPGRARALAQRTLTEPELGTWRRHAAGLDDMRFFLDAFEQGAGGVVADYIVYAEPWGFDLDAVRAPVRLWHGDSDSLVPLEHARLLADRLPTAELTVLPNAGHLLPYDEIGEMLRSLTESPSAT